MTFDDMQARWAEYDRKLDAATVSAVTQIQALERARSSTQRLTLSVASGVAINGMLALCFGFFIARHAGEPRWFFPALALDIAVIALLIRGVHQLILMQGTDIGASIVEAQRRVESLRLKRIQTNRWALTLAPLLWVPLLIVALKGLFGVNAYETFASGWWIANVVLGVAFIPFMMWVSKRFGDRFHDTSWAKRAVNDFTGRSQTAAAKFVGELTKFERE